MINLPVQAIPIAIISLSFLCKENNNRRIYIFMVTLGKSIAALTLVGKPSARFSNL
jgi:hypothetical protein